MGVTPRARRVVTPIACRVATTRARRVATAFVVSLFLATLPAAPSMAASSPTAEGGQGDEFEAALQRTLETVAGYELGDSRQPLADLRRLVLAAQESPARRALAEERMVAFLAAEATPAGTQVVAEQLGLVGTAAAVPALVRLLRREATADAALYALQRIPDPSVDAAMRAALPDAPPGARVGIVNALGERKDPEAVPALAVMIEGDDASAARAAAIALGKIGGEEAADALAAARAGTRGELHRLVVDAYLRCADHFVSAGAIGRAVSMYQDVYDNQDATDARIAALRGLVRADDVNAVAVIRSALARDNRALQSVAAGLVRELPPGADVGVLVAAVPVLAPATQVQLLSALAERREAAAYPAVIVAIEHHDDEVRAAALNALATLGGAGDVERLAGHAAAARTAGDREAARQALAFLPGAAINAEIIERVPEASAAVRAELVGALGRRYATEATEVVLGTAADPDRAVRVESLRALAIIAEPAVVDRVTGLLLVESDAAVRSEAERAVALVARKNPEPRGRASGILAALSSATDSDVRASLISVLGRVGDPSALPAILAELHGADIAYQRAAINALSVWPDAGPASDLLAVARTAEDRTTGILALRAYVDVLRRGVERDDPDSVGSFLSAMELATEPQERRMALAGLGDLRSVAALAATVPYLDDPELKGEAEAALRGQVNWLRRLDDPLRQELLDEALRRDLGIIREKAVDERLLEWVEEVLASGRERP